jgi:ABC-2 type transport system permease protein
VSPFRPGELIAGKTLPVAVLGLVDLLVLVTVALFRFQVPFQGALLALLAASILHLLSGLGMGLLISTVSTTQQEAFMAVPHLHARHPLSGFIFPVSSMPEVFQWMTNLSPVRHFLVIVRSIFLRA